jgi:hypothetical protein
MVDFAVQQEGDETLHAEVQCFRRAHNHVGDLAEDLANLQKLYNDTRWEEQNSLQALTRANAFRCLKPRILHDAPNNTMNDANGAKGMDTLRATAPESTNACCVTGTGTKSNIAESPTSDAEQEEYAVSLTTTPEWPTLTARRMSGPLDDGKDANKGVMSRETSHT